VAPHSPSWRSDSHRHLGVFFLGPPPQALVESTAAAASPNTSRAAFPETRQRDPDKPIRRQFPAVYLRRRSDRSGIHLQCADESQRHRLLSVHASGD